MMKAETVMMEPRGTKGPKGLLFHFAIVLFFIKLQLLIILKLEKFFLLFFFLLAYQLLALIQDFFCLLKGFAGAYLKKANSNLLFPVSIYGFFVRRLQGSNRFFKT